MHPPLINDFSAAYMLVRNLKSKLGRDPGCEAGTDMVAMDQILSRGMHYEQSMSRLLYRDAAHNLALVFSEGPEDLSAEAWEQLYRHMRLGRFKVRLAVCEALGQLSTKLPLDRCEIAPGSVSDEETDFEHIAALAGAQGRSRHEGRSVLMETSCGNLLVVKAARTPQEARGLALEGAWLERLSGLDLERPCHVPRPISMGKGHVARVRGLPGKTGPAPHALAFVADPAYFIYPNDHRPGKLLGLEDFSRTMADSAFLLGRLASLGMAHTAPIPLFHNRVQAARREDEGFYEWNRMGRLDQWLDSCRYPNFGLSGLRDFEHMATFEKTTRTMFRHMGSHVLSLALVAGSWFRNHEPQRRGLDRSGGPTDNKDLFDHATLVKLLAAISDNYQQGFAHAAPLPHPMDLERLAGRMIHEMGVDQHMNETLRTTDQLEMGRDKLTRFLAERGWPEKEAGQVAPGERELVIISGPHLGGFNQQISLPEIIEYTGTTCALAMAAKKRPPTFS